MRITRSLSLACLLLFGGVSAQNRPAAAPGLPPIIDRDLFFGDPEIAAAAGLARRPVHLAFLKPWKKTRNIWVKKLTNPFSAANLLTTETKRPIPGYLWSRDSKYILYVKDNDGDENFNVYAVDPGASAAAGSEAPAFARSHRLEGSSRRAVTAFPRTIRMWSTSA